MWNYACKFVVFAENWKSKITCISMNNTSSSTFKMFDTAVQGHQFNSVDYINSLK